LEYKVDFTEKGENHTVKGYGGQILNNVTKAVGYNYRNTNEKGTTAASKGTIFTFTDYSQAKEQAIITTKEGMIHIVDEIPVFVNGKALERHGNPTTKSVSVTQSAGQAQFVSSNNGVNYPNLNYAINTLLKEIENEEDPEDLADDYMCLGDLYMDLNKPQEAIENYQEAVELYEDELGEDDLDTIDAKLSLADAYFEANNKAKGNQLAYACIKILQTLLKEDEAELAYLNQIRDQNGAYTTCSEMVEICEYLADAFDLIGNDANSQYYTNKANSLCK
jgi:tetratricopeptide (TPR) repeat protein